MATHGTMQETPPTTSLFLSKEILWHIYTCTNKACSTTTRDCVPKVSQHWKPRQGRKAAEMASNRHPDNIITTALLRLQAWQKNYTCSKEYKQYQLLRHTLKELILKTYTQLKQTIKLKEKTSLQKYNCLPSSDDAEYTDICKQLKYIQWRSQDFD